MTQTGGLDILLAWTIFGAILAVLAYLLLRHEKDPFQDITTPTADQSEPPPGSTFPPDSQAAP
jgi:uncharacterized membrane protein YedE/YeeE